MSAAAPHPVAAAAPTVSLVAPCFNEEEVLPEFLRRAVAACEATGRSFEIALVDDGSRDRTWPLIAAAAATDPRVRGLRLRRNHGHQLALTAGLNAARGDRVLAIDADLQDPPELLGPMLELMEAEDADVVYGQRRRRAGETGFKRATAGCSTASWASFPTCPSRPIPATSGCCGARWPTCWRRCPRVTASCAAWSPG